MSKDKITLDNLIEKQLIRIKLTKLKEVDDSTVPNNIEEGHIHEGYTYRKGFKEPTVGSAFYLLDFHTSVVTEIIDDNTFKTLNSIYKWEVTDGTDG